MSCIHHWHILIDNWNSDFSSTYNTDIFYLTFVTPVTVTRTTLTHLTWHLVSIPVSQSANQSRTSFCSWVLVVLDMSFFVSFPMQLRVLLLTINWATRNIFSIRKISSEYKVDIDPEMKNKKQFIHTFPSIYNSVFRIGVITVN